MPSDVHVLASIHAKHARNTPNTPDKDKNTVFRPKMIVSGSQTGVDYGALLAACGLGIATGGRAPKEFCTGDVPQKPLKTVSGFQARYDEQILLNVQMSDIVLLIAANFASKEVLPVDCLANRHRKPCAQVQYIYCIKPEEVRRIRLWLEYFKPKVLMIAGDRENAAPGIQCFTTDFVRRLFEPDKILTPLRKATYNISARWD